MSGDLSIRVERPAEAWDDFVRATEGGSFCHLSGWAEVMEDAMGHRYVGLVARRGGPDGVIEGVLPMVDMRSLLFGKHLISMPFLNYGGPLGSEAAVSALLRRAVQIAEERSSDSLQLRARDPLRTEAGFEDALASDREKVTVLLDLPEDDETLWMDFKGKVRNQVRRPRKDGMHAEIGGDQLDAFYVVFAHNMRDLGTPVLPRPFFESIAAAFGDEVIFAAVYSDGIPVAGSCGFVFGEEYEMTWASSLREYNRSAPNMLLYWSCMEEAIGRGLEIFNFGRCTPGEGTHRFKLQWGGYDEPLHWRRWPAGPAAEEADDKGALFERAIDVWQRLPLGIANRIGPMVSRRLPWY